MLFGKWPDGACVASLWWTAFKSVARTYKPYQKHTYSPTFCNLRPASINAGTAFPRKCVHSSSPQACFTRSFPANYSLASPKNLSKLPLHPSIARFNRSREMPKRNRRWVPAPVNLTSVRMPASSRWGKTSLKNSAACAPSLLVNVFSFTPVERMKARTILSMITISWSDATAEVEGTGGGCVKTKPA